MSQLNRVQLIGAITATVPADLQPEAEASLSVPQWGPHHMEGYFLSDHLALVLEELERMKEGQFHPDMPRELRRNLRRVADVYAPLTMLYVLLYNVDKMNCMTFVYGDGREELMTWAAWNALIDMTPAYAAEIRRGGWTGLHGILRDQNVTQISYYQKLPEGGARMYGKVVADRLAGREDVPTIVVKAIAAHEVAYEFATCDGINLPLFRKFFEGMSDDELMFCLLVNLADQLASHGENGPDIYPFLLLVETATAYKTFLGVEAELRAIPNLDKAKLDRALADLFKSTGAFRDEFRHEVVARIVRECAVA
jgi:hypothetical protein